MPAWYPIRPTFIFAPWDALKSGLHDTPTATSDARRGQAK
jgi:hypothetical protein